MILKSSFISRAPQTEESTKERDSLVAAVESTNMPDHLLMSDVQEIQGRKYVTDILCVQNDSEVCQSTCASARRREEKHHKRKRE